MASSAPPHDGHPGLPARSSPAPPRGHGSPSRLARVSGTDLDDSFGAGGGGRGGGPPPSTAPAGAASGGGGLPAPPGTAPMAFPVFRSSQHVTPLTFEQPSRKAYRPAQRVGSSLLDLQPLSDVSAVSLSSGAAAHSRNAMAHTAGKLRGEAHDPASREARTMRRPPPPAAASSSSASGTRPCSQDGRPSRRQPSPGAAPLPAPATPAVNQLMQRAMGHQMLSAEPRMRALGREHSGTAAQELSAMHVRVPHGASRLRKALKRPQPSPPRLRPVATPPPVLEFHAWWAELGQRVNLTIEFDTLRNELAVRYRDPATPFLARLQARLWLPAKARACLCALSGRRRAARSRLPPHAR